MHVLQLQCAKKLNYIICLLLVPQPILSFRLLSLHFPRLLLQCCPVCWRETADCSLTKWCQRSSLHGQTASFYERRGNYGKAAEKQSYSCPRCLEIHLSCILNLLSELQQTREKYVPAQSGYEIQVILL